MKLYFRFHPKLMIFKLNLKRRRGLTLMIVKLRMEAFPPLKLLIIAEVLFLKDLENKITNKNRMDIIGVIQLMIFLLKVFLKLLMDKMLNFHL